LLGCAQTGTGKTAAFAIPILQLLYLDKQKHKEQKSIKTLILTPTRELAIQISESFTAYGKHTGLKNLVIFGGVSQNPQTDALRRGVDILIATPGRLLDLMNQRFVHLDHFKMLSIGRGRPYAGYGFRTRRKENHREGASEQANLVLQRNYAERDTKLADSILHTTC
jgi:ATP-dependent RNA helicase RhlE